MTNGEVARNNAQLVVNAVEDIVKGYRLFSLFILFCFSLKKLTNNLFFYLFNFFFFFFFLFIYLF